MIETTEKEKKKRVSMGEQWEFLVLYIWSPRKRKEKKRLTVFIESLAKSFQIEKDTKPYFKKPYGHENNKNQNHVGTS